MGGGVPVRSIAASILCAALFLGCGPRFIALDDGEVRFTCEPVPVEGEPSPYQQQHCIDAGPGYYYEYYTFEFESGETKYFARSYVRDVDEAHFLRKEVGGVRTLLTLDDLSSVGFREAVGLLRAEGRTRLEYLSRTAENGYSPVPD